MLKLTEFELCVIEALNSIVVQLGTLVARPHDKTWQQDKYQDPRTMTAPTVPKPSRRRPKPREKVPFIEDDFKPRVRARITQLEEFAGVRLTKAVRMKLAMWFYRQSPTAENAERILRSLPTTLGKDGSKIFDGYAVWMTKLNVECARKQQGQKPEAG